ncbi:MAG: glycosyl hydrolase [Verrucomicrobiae bacterium]|nr:glycosyl hydrolase [Verrucomicrobiae bacterium]
MKTDSLTALFQNPTSAYRGKPFWAWNGRLEENELRRQIRVFREMGMGGAFLHSRVGLSTPYLSKEWFRLVNACADESEKNGVEAWLYDEDRWPSGAAGGLVTKDPRYRLRRLKIELLDKKSYEAKGDELGVYAGMIRGDEISGVRVGRGRVTAGAGETILVCRAVAQPPSPWYNDQTYLDTLSAKAVKRFIEVTHQAYAKNTLNRFDSRVVPGIFTDEPNHGGCPDLLRHHDERVINLPWTDELPKAFRKRHEYDLLPQLIELVFKVDGREFSKVRRDYFDTVTDLFSRHFMGMIGEWCKKNGQIFTGHVLEESTLQRQTCQVGSAMRCYEPMQAPGIDILCGQGLSREGGMAPEYMTAKQCASAAHQFGRKWMLSELYGCTGWQFTFAEHKAVGDWQAALGVNLRCQHLSWYTMEGEAKRDYPASIFFQSSWWRDYPVVEDYFSRVGVLMTQGEPVRDVAVLHPIESAWGLITVNDHTRRGSGSAGENGVQKLNRQLEEIQQWLLEEHFDFDYVDEDLLARHGSARGGQLQMAKAAYRAVVVPPARTLRSSTLKLLEKVAAGGGKVIFAGDVPDHLDATPSSLVKDFAGMAGQVNFSRAALVTALAKAPDLRRVSIAGSNGGEFAKSLYQLRHDAKTGQAFVFICNTSQKDASGPLSVRLPFKGTVEEWDAVTGQVWDAGAREECGAMVVQTSLPPVGSRLFAVQPESKSKLSKRSSFREIKRQTLSPQKWMITRDEPNGFPLDVAEYSIQGGAWKGPLEILKIDRAVRDAAGLRHRGGAMCQPWAQKNPPQAKKTKVGLRYRFDVDVLPASGCHLVMEQPARFVAKLNGQVLPTTDDEGWWVDNSFRKIPVAPWLLRQGENELTLETEYAVDSGLESLYFVGEFGVAWKKRRPVIEKLPESLALGDWGKQGFPCYGGAISYGLTVKCPAGGKHACFLELSAWEGVMIRVMVNGRKAGAIAWHPYELDLTPFLTAGENRLEIQVLGSRRNLFGPLHHAGAYPIWTGPGQFVSEGKMWTDDYVMIPCGLMKPPVLSWRE